MEKKPLKNNDIKLNKLKLFETTYNSRKENSKKHETVLKIDTQYTCFSILSSSKSYSDFVGPLVGKYIIFNTGHCCVIILRSMGFKGR